jgi:hypothetical protein
MCSNRNLSAEPCSKNAGETSIVLWITEIIPTSCNPNQNRITLWQIFSSNKASTSQ